MLEFMTWGPQDEPMSSCNSWYLLWWAYVCRQQLDDHLVLLGLSTHLACPRYNADPRNLWLLIILSRLSIIFSMDQLTLVVGQPWQITLESSSMNLRLKHGAPK